MQPVVTGRSVFLSYTANERQHGQTERTGPSQRFPPSVGPEEVTR